jgi:hypothetical protein
LPAADEVMLRKKRLGGFFSNEPDFSLAEKSRYTATCVVSFFREF